MFARSCKHLIKNRASQVCVSHCVLYDANSRLFFVIFRNIIKTTLEKKQGEEDIYWWQTFSDKKNHLHWPEKSS